MEAGSELEDLARRELRRISGHEFDEMARIGLFQDEHVELLRGVLVVMGQQNPPHARITAWLGQLLSRLLDFDAYDLRQHTNYAPSDDSRPEPDIAVFRRDYALATLPTTALLLVEVADTSLRKDRKIKLPLYAECGVPEYWIVDVNASAVEVYTEPAPTGYGRAQVYRPGDTLVPTQMRHVAIAISDIPFVPRS